MNHSWFEKFETLLNAMSRNLTTSDRLALSAELRRLPEDQWEDFGQLVLIELLTPPKKLQPFPEPIQRVAWRVGRRIRRAVHRDQVIGSIPDFDPQAKPFESVLESPTDFLKSLTGEEALVVHLFMEDMNANEIAQKLGVSRYELKICLDRIRRKYRQEFLG